MSKVILWDLMDTVVKDPFFTHMADFFGITFDQLLIDKHPTLWGQFELGMVDESALGSHFFVDERPVDVAALKDMLRDAYAFADGMQELLTSLTSRGVEMHALSNYPHWYELIEERLQLSRYMQLSFISCRTGVRKPEPRAYHYPCQTLARPPGELIFVDDRVANVEAACQEGLHGVHFTGDVDSLRRKLDELLSRESVRPAR